MTAVDFMQSLMLVLHNAQAHCCAEAFGYRAQTIADLPCVYLMPFPSYEGL